MSMFKSSKPLHRLIIFALILSPAVLSGAPRKPVVLYSRYFNAIGEDRYLPDGTYKQVLQRLNEEFEVRVHADPLVPRTLKGVDVVIIANPSEKAVGTNPPPNHFGNGEIRALTIYVNQGGGLIILGNQENHNLELETTNQLLSRFGLRFTNEYTDAKKLVIPKSTPILGGLTWAFYTGNSLMLTGGEGHPRALVENDLTQKPIQGPRDARGMLIAVSEPNQGRVVAITDAGFITDAVLKGEGIGGIVIKDHDNWEIFRRLVHWSAK